MITFYSYIVGGKLRSKPRKVFSLVYSIENREHKEEFSFRLKEKSLLKFVIFRVSLQRIPFKFFGLVHNDSKLSHLSNCFLNDWLKIHHELRNEISTAHFEK